MEQSSNNEQLELFIAESLIEFNKELHDQEQCNICLEDFKEKERLVQLHCNAEHIFHPVCIKEWMRRRQHPGCPLCRTPIDLPDHP